MRRITSKRGLFIAAGIVVFPLVLIFLGWLLPGLGLAWLFLEVLYYLPVSFLGEPFFRSTEIGLYPNALGRLIASLVYLALWLILASAFAKRKRANRNES